MHQHILNCNQLASAAELQSEISDSLYIFIKFW